jgi:hypothetical protein
MPTAATMFPLAAIRLALPKLITRLSCGKLHERQGKEIDFN